MEVSSRLPLAQDRAAADENLRDATDRPTDRPLPPPRGLGLEGVLLVVKLHRTNGEETMA